MLRCVDRVESVALCCEVVGMVVDRLLFGLVSEWSYCSVCVYAIRVDGGHWKPDYLLAFPSLCRRKIKAPPPCEMEGLIGVSTRRVALGTGPGSWLFAQAASPTVVPRAS